MSEKHIVVQGAMCKCQFGQAPDKLKVLTHQKEYANDKSASKKLIVTTKEIGGATFEKNTFGNCTKNGGPPPPCKIMVTEWQNFYDKVQLSNGGFIILEDSKAVCAVAARRVLRLLIMGKELKPASKTLKMQIKMCSNK